MGILSRHSTSSTRYSSRASVGIFISLRHKRYKVAATGSEWAHSIPLLQLQYKYRTYQHEYNYREDPKGHAHVDTNALIFAGERARIQH